MSNEVQEAFERGFNVGKASNDSEIEIEWSRVVRGAVWLAAYAIERSRNIGDGVFEAADKTLSEFEGRFFPKADE